MAAAVQTVLAVGEECPADLLDDLGHPDAPLYSSLEVVRTLLSERECSVNVVRTRSGRMAVLKTYYKYRLSEVARQQVRFSVAVREGGRLAQRDAMDGRAVVRAAGRHKNKSP